MELEDSEDLDDVPTKSPAPERYNPPSPVEHHAEHHAEQRSDLSAAETQPEDQAEAGQTETSRAFRSGRA